MLKVDPPQLTDQPILARMKRIGVEPDWSFEIENVDSVVRRRLTQAPADGQRLMALKVPTLARVING
ncbi:hypothetical protein [Microvirga sp. 17 mud 1-3]|uniref:hypothetical protein n=1 Tax=Microvirga sp. 17 mud 1-3 TaxID=2082949 RepID=UPI001FE1BCCF|nr:hypothetical protein [Microvirga sp. 17 mud 1-3]